MCEPSAIQARVRIRGYIGQRCEPVAALLYALVSVSVSQCLSVDARG